MILTSVGMIKKSIAATLSLNGAMYFNGTATSNILYSKDADLMFQSGDFTIEWYQYQTDNNSNPRIFSIGTWNSAELAVSIEGGTFYLWAGGSFIFSASAGTFKNQWVHFAIARSGTSIKVFKNGTQLGSTITSSYNFNNSSYDLRIGNETTTTSASAYGGWLTNFRWVKGSALYTNNFSRPVSPLTNVSGCKVLLLATNNGSVTTDTTGRANTASNINWYAFNENTMSV